MTSRYVILLAVLCACILSAACTGGQLLPPGSGTADARDKTGGSPSVLITTPAFDGGVIAGTVTVTIQVQNFSLAAPGSGKDGEGTGHIICYLDAVPPVSPGTPALTQPGSFMITAEPSCTWQQVPAGTHTFAVELVHDDNTPLVPPVIDAVDVTAVPAGLLP